MEVILIGTLANAGLILVSGLVNYGIHKYNRSKLKKHITSVVEKLEENAKIITDIQATVSRVNTPNAPYELPTPSEFNYVKPNANASNHYMQ